MRKAAEEMERHRFEEAERKNEDKVVGNDKERRRLVERLKETDSPSPPLSALTMARNIDRLDEIEYPQGIKSPKTELTQNAKDGKFRYDRDFLLQFINVCTEKPPHLPALDILYLELLDQASYTIWFGQHRQPSADMSVSGPHSASIGLGVGDGFKPSAPPNPFQMGQFSTPRSKLTNEEHFLISTGARSASVGSGPTAAALLTHPTMIPTPSQGRPNRPVGGKVTSRKRREKLNDPGKPALAQQGPVSGYRSAAGALLLEPVDMDTPEAVDRKVRALLNKITVAVEKFDSVSDQIISLANKSENEQDGRTLIQVIRLIFEQAADDANWSEMYARLCRKMMEKISPKVQDYRIKNADGQPIAGGRLFRKYLLNRCQEAFERIWVAKETTARAAAANEKKGDESKLYSEEYYAAQKAKRQGLGLIKFMAELFKLQILTERAMHECIKKLLGNVDDPEEEDVESLCQLLRAVGRLLDVPKAHAHMAMYFSRMKELGKSNNVSSRMQFMLQDVIELRERKWQPRNAVNAPTTLAQVHEAAAKDKERAAQGSQAHRGEYSMSGIGLKRGLDRGTEPGPDGWTVAGGSQPRPLPRAGDLSQFGKVSKVASIAPTASEGEPETTPVTQMSEADVKKMIDEGVKEFFAVGNLEEADMYFTALTEEHRFRLVDKLVGSALEGKEADARLVAEFFARPASQRECSPDVLEAGFDPLIELLDDIAIDAPKAFEYMAIMLKGAGLDRDEERLKRIVEKAVDSDKLLQLVTGT